MQATTKTQAHPFRWILSPAADSLLFVALPALILAALSLLTVTFSPVELYIALFGAMSLGHHLPGFLKAYGDKQTFAAHKKTLILAPLLLYPAMLYCVCQDIAAIITLRAAWSLWHGFMQAYGILRNYDARSGGLARMNAAMDRILAALLYGSYLVFWHQDNSFDVLSRLYASGVPMISKETFAVAAAVVTTALYVFLVIYVLFHVYLKVKGHAFNPVKLLYAASMVVFVVGAFATHYLVGFMALMAGELYHDLQYNAIAYSAGRQAAKAGRVPSRAMLALFGGSWRQLLLYVLGVGVYGALHFLNDMIPDGRMPVVFNIFAAFVLTSSFLHYYFDGFIWRRPTASAARRVSLKDPKLVQPVVALGALAFFVLAERPAVPGSEIRVDARFAELLPESEHANAKLADALAKTGQLGSATFVYERVLTLNPDSAHAHLALGRILARTGGDAEQAKAHLEQAARLDPRLAGRAEKITHRLMAVNVDP